MFALAVVVLLCDFFVKVRSQELSDSEKSLKDYASIRSFFIDPSQFSWPYGLQASKTSFLDKFQFPGLQSTHFKGASSRRLPRMYIHMDRKIKNQPISKYYPPYWMSQLYSDPSHSASTKVAVVKPLPFSMFYAKPSTRHSSRYAAEMKLPSVAISSVLEKQVPFLVEKQNKLAAQMTAEQFMQLQGEKYGMLTEKTIVEKQVPFPYAVEKYVPYPVEKSVPYPVEKHVPFPVEKLVPYPVPVPVRTPVEIPVPFPMVKFDPVFVPVREPLAGRPVALWMRQNVTSIIEEKNLNVNESTNFLTEQFEGQPASTEGQFQISPTITQLPANTSLLEALPIQLLDGSTEDSQFAASDNRAETTELTSRSSVSSLPSQ